MKFTVGFKTIYEHEDVLEGEKKEYGIGLLDEARKLTTSQLKKEIVKSYSLVNPKSVLKIEINEEKARESGHFKDNTWLWVKVPNRFANDFIEEKIRVEWNKEDDAITSVFIECTVNEDKIIEKWIADGFPKKY